MGAFLAVGGASYAVVPADSANAPCTKELLLAHFLSAFWVVAKGREVLVAVTDLKNSAS